MLIDELIAAGPVITDGAWGTQLQSRGLTGGACPDQWNLSHPDDVEQVPRAYVEAGSQIVLTNTFRANRVALASYDLAEQVVEINQAGVAISRRAAGDRARVFASIGPSGKMLISGEVTQETLSAAFVEQANAIAAAGADAIVIETMAELEEAELALGRSQRNGTARRRLRRLRLRTQQRLHHDGSDTRASCPTTHLSRRGCSRRQLRTRH